LKPTYRRRPLRNARPSGRTLVALAVAVAVVIAAAVLIVRGDRTPRPGHAAVRALVPELALRSPDGP
jgi:hypothetical protein